MKCQVTKKQVMKNYCKVIAIGYCNAQYLLEYYNRPFAYSAGIYGRSCDYYEVQNICICTGYNTTGKWIDHKIVKKYEDKAQKIILGKDTYEQKKKKVNKLLMKFIVEVIA